MGRFSPRSPPLSSKESYSTESATSSDCSSSRQPSSVDNYQVIMAQPFAQKRAGQIHPNGGSRGPQTIENWVHLTSGKEVLKIACLEDVSYVFFILQTILTSFLLLFTSPYNKTLSRFQPIKIMLYTKVVFKGGYTAPLISQTVRWL